MNLERNSDVCSFMHEGPAEPSSRTKRSKLGSVRTTAIWIGAGAWVVLGWLWTLWCLLIMFFVHYGGDPIGAGLVALALAPAIASWALVAGASLWGRWRKTTSSPRG